MDMITLAMAKSYTDSKSVTSAEVKEVPGKVLGSGALEGGAFFGVGKLGLVTGETYFVEYDGTVEKGVYNGTFIETSCGGCVDDSEDDWLALGFDGYSTITISTVETIHPIDPKYIPWDSAPGGGSGGGLPVVKLTTVATGSRTNLTDDEQALMNEVDLLEMPIVFQVPVTFPNGENINVSVLLNRMSDNNGGYYYTNYHPITDSYQLKLVIARKATGAKPWYVTGGATNYTAE